MDILTHGHIKYPKPKTQKIYRNSTRRQHFKYYTGKYLFLLLIYVAKDKHNKH